MDTQDIPGQCKLCGRTRPLTFHHLIPRTCHSNKWFKKTFSREEMSRGIDLCYECHSHLHGQFSEKELGRHLNTQEALLANESIQRFVEWMRKR